MIQKTRPSSCRVANLDCENDAAALRRDMAEIAGMAEIIVYPKSAKIRVSYDPGAVSDGELKAKLSEISEFLVIGSGLRMLRG